MPLGALIDHAPHPPARSARARDSPSSPGRGPCRRPRRGSGGSFAEAGVGAAGVEPGVADRGAVGAGAGGSGCAKGHNAHHHRGHEAAEPGRDRVWHAYRPFQRHDQRSNPNSLGPVGCGAAAGAGRGAADVGGGGEGAGCASAVATRTGAGAGAGAATAGEPAEAEVFRSHVGRGRLSPPRRVWSRPPGGPGALAARRSCGACRRTAGAGSRTAASGASPMSDSSGGGSGRRMRLGRPPNKARQPSTPRASLATLGQRMRERLPIAPYNPGESHAAPRSLGAGARPL